MFKSLFFLFVYSFFSVLPASALNLMDIEDESKDKSISIKYLPKFIRTIFKSRADYLKEGIDHLQDESNMFVSLGSARGGWQVVTDRASLLSENSEAAQAQKLLLQAYQNQYAFFNNDPLTLYKNPTTPLSINLTKPGDLVLLFWHTSKKIQQNYNSLRQNLETLPPHSSAMSMLLEPIFYNEESAIEDLIVILRVIRPHLNKAIQPKAELGSQGKKALAHGKLALKEVAMLDAAYQWRDLFSQPEIQKTYRDSLINLIKIDIDIEEKPSLLMTTPSPEKQLETQRIETTTPTGPQNENKKEEIVNLALQNANNKQEVQPQNLLTVTTVKQQQQVPISQRENKKKKKKKTIAPPEERVKTRPTEEALFLQSLNGYFEEDPITKASEKLKEPQEIEAKKEHTQRLKVLHKLLYSAKTHSINVDKTARLLEYFGLVESSDLNHGKMKPKPLELWLKGERLLIEVPPVVTMAVSHTSGSKRYFKPYVVKRMRDALLKAGFEKLLPENKAAKRRTEN